MFQYSVTMSWLKVALLMLLFYIGTHDCSICIKEVCEYKFVIQHARTMSYAVGRKVYSVGLNGTQLQIIGNSYRPEGNNDMFGQHVQPNDVITADGVVRTVITINGQFPGPTIEVAEGAEVVIHVTNRLGMDGLTIHWHGLSLRGAPWMDGTPYVTQCPILPRQTFTYRFKATPSGTHWYYSRISNQHIDGLYGLFIVHKVLPSLTYFTVAVQDWYHVEGQTRSITSPYGIPNTGYRGNGEDFYSHESIRAHSTDGIETNSIKFRSALLNGRGRWKDLPFPLTEFSVVSGEKYLFRLVNSGAEFAFRISVDSHPLEVIALDGHDIEPLVVDSLIINVGERFDFEITANQTPSRYWFRADSLRDPRDGVVEEVKGMLIYAEDTGKGDPVTRPRECTTEEKCVVLNCPFTIFPKEFNSVCRSIETTRSAKSETTSIDILNDTDVVEVFFNLGYNWGSSVNGRKFIGPSAPLYENSTETVSCVEACSDPEKGCICTFIRRLPYNKTIQMVVSNLDEQLLLSHHSLYLHGHHFAVVKVGYPEFNQSTGRFGKANDDIICENPICESPRWNRGPPRIQLEKPPIKDTVNVPARGYVVVRFRSDHPGLRVLECTAVSHHNEGMTMIIDEAPGHYPMPPSSFSRCPSSTGLSRHTNTDEGKFKSGKAKPRHPTDREKRNDCDEKPRPFPDNVVLSLRELTGIIIGCIVLGVAITLIVGLLFAACLRCAGTKRPKQTPNTP